MRILPIAWHEFLGRLRSEPIQPLLGFGLVTMALAALVGLGLTSLIPTDQLPNAARSSFGFFGRGPTWEIAFAGHKGSILFLILSLGLVGVALGIAPMVASTALNRDRDGRAIDALLLTGVNPLDIVAGKLLAAYARTVLVLFAAAPFFALAWLYRGAPLVAIIGTASVALAAALLATAIGLFVACAVRTGLLALVYSYGLLVLVVLLGPAAFAFAFSIGGAAEWVPLLFSSAPFAVLSGHGELIEAAQVLFPIGVRVEIGRVTAPWLDVSIIYSLLAATITGYLALSTLLLALGSAILDPFHPLRALRVPATFRRSTR